MSNKLLVAGLLASSMIAAPAMAAVTITGTTAVAGYSGDTNHGLSITTIPGAFSLDLDLDSSTATPRSNTAAVFQIGSPEKDVTWLEDTTPHDIVVTFSFTNPNGIGDAPITGSTRGTWLGNLGLVTWDNTPLTFSFGDGGAFSVQLQDTYFKLDGANTDVDAKFKLLSEPNSAVPEPATWAMMIGGFGLIGAAMRRRRRISVTYA